MLSPAVLAVATVFATIGGMALMIFLVTRMVKGEKGYTPGTKHREIRLGALKFYAYSRSWTTPSAALMMTFMVLIAMLPVFLYYIITAPPSSASASSLSDFSTIELVETVDLESDSWAAECDAYLALQTQKKDKKNGLALQCGEFTGARTLWRVDTSYGGGEVRVKFRMTVEEGRAGLVLVHPDGTVLRFEEEDSPYDFVPGPGETRLRLIGEGAKLELTVFVLPMDGMEGHWPKWERDK